MKPLTLQFENVRSYATFGPVDFTDRSLVGILGDTGAGKSTIIEALCLALYGQGSWQGATISDLIADAAPHMAVDLSFSHEGQTWRVQRTYFANTRPTQALLRNLGTGAAFDNVRTVDAQIEKLLRMRIDAFKSAVVLPQGRFTTLLHASAPDRAKLLKGIFGADLLAIVETLTTSRLEALNRLLTEARIERAGLPQDPAAAARAAQDAHATYRQLADSLDEHVSTTRALVTQARDDVATANATRRMHDTLAAITGRVDDSALTDSLAATQLAAEEIAAETETLNGDEAASRDLAAAADEAIKAAETAGLGRSALDAASTALASTPARGARLAEHADELDVEQQAIEAATARLNELTDSLADHEAQVVQAETHAATTEAAAQAASQAATRLRNDIEDILAAAHTVRQTREAHAAATAQRDQLAGELVLARTAADAAAEAETHAEMHLSALRRGEAAVASSIGLHPGDDCPVCARTLPDSWQAPADASDALTDAQAKTTRARSDASKAAGKVQLLVGQHAPAELAVKNAAAALAESEPAMTRALDQLADSDIFAALADVDVAKVVAKVRAEAMSAADPAVPPIRARDAAAALSASAATYAAAQRTRATQANTAASDTRGKFDSDKREAQSTAAGLAQRQTALASSRTRWRSDLTEVAGVLRSLPAAVRTAFPKLDFTSVPAWLTDAAGPFTEASEVVSTASAALAGHEQKMREARERLANVATDRDSLRVAADRRVARPARAACKAVEQAVNSLPELALVGVQVTVPRMPDDDGVPSAVARYLTEVRAMLADASTRLAQQLDEVDAQALAALHRAANAWRAALAAASPGGDDAFKDDGDSSAVDGDAHVLDVEALTPVTDAAAVAKARAQEESSRADQARAAIARATELDSAVDAGEARASALTALRAALRPAKFPAHLVTHRTATLLGLASELFAQLSSDEFGFAADFQIVARRTGAVRDPKTLSGGETFQASLALALSLVELYSRSAGRLGALFLDEGFGSLDSESLATALEALSAETGGDKLVAVISHLHAVAEAVGDVLWVSKQAGSSQARWLDSTEIDALVNADVAAGLLAAN